MLVPSEVRQPWRMARIWVSCLRGADITGEGRYRGRGWRWEDSVGHGCSIVSFGTSCARQSRLALLADFLVYVYLLPILQDSGEISLLILDFDISQFTATCRTHLLPLCPLVFKTQGSFGELRADRSRVNRGTNFPSSGAPCIWYSVFPGWVVVGMGIQGPALTSPVALEETSPPCRTHVNEVPRQLHFLYWKETGFFFWQNALLCQTLFFFFWNKEHHDFPICFLCESKAKGFEFFHLLCKVSFSRMGNKNWRLQRDLALLILNVTSRRDRRLLASSETLSPGYSWVAWGWNRLVGVRDEGWAGEKLPVVESVHVPLYHVVSVLLFLCHLSCVLTKVMAHSRDIEQECIQTPTMNGKVNLIVPSFCKIASTLSPEWSFFSDALIFSVFWF